MRKARIGNGNGSSKNGDNNNVDDWQSCWVDEAEDARISRKDTTCSTFKAAATTTTKPPSPATAAADRQQEQGTGAGKGREIHSSSSSSAIQSARVTAVQGDHGGQRLGFVDSEFFCAYLSDSKCILR